MAILKAFQLGETKNNNHGCSGVSVVILPWPARSTRQGKVVHISGGCSCGADTSLEEGDVVQLPEWFSGGWEKAAEDDPSFWRVDISLAGQTLVRPSDLLLKKERARKEPEEEEGLEELRQCCRRQEE